MRLRDHDQPCEHGSRWLHLVEEDLPTPMTLEQSGTMRVSFNCPGGREVKGVLRDWCDTHDRPFGGTACFIGLDSCVRGHRLIVEVGQR